MNLKIGSFYKDRVGEVHGPLVVNTVNTEAEYAETRYPFGFRGCEWSADGRYNLEVPKTRLDLVEECAADGSRLDVVCGTSVGAGLSDAIPCDAYDTAAQDALAELSRARSIFGPMYNMHEGYAIILEELDEVWQIVKQKQKNRNLADARKEMIQVAAMALAFAVEVCDEERGRK